MFAKKHRNHDWSSSLPACLKWAHLSLQIKGDTSAPAKLSGLQGNRSPYREFKTANKLLQHRLNTALASGQGCVSAFPALAQTITIVNSGLEIRRLVTQHCVDECAKDAARCQI